MKSDLHLCHVSTVEPHYNGTEGTDCIFALLPKSGVAIWAISVKKSRKKQRKKTFLARYPIVRLQKIIASLCLGVRVHEKE